MGEGILEEVEVVGCAGGALVDDLVVVDVRVHICLTITAHAQRANTDSRESGIRGKDLPSL